MRIERKRSIPATKKGAIGLAVERLVDASVTGSVGENGIPTGTLNFFPRIDGILEGFVFGRCLTDLILSFCSDELRLRLGMPRKRISSLVSMHPPCLLRPAMLTREYHFTWASRHGDTIEHLSCVSHFE